MTALITNIAARVRPQTLPPALGLAGLIVVTEYLARHFAIFWLPVIGAYRVNDMLTSGVFYIALVWLTIPAEQRDLGAINRTVREVVSGIRHRPAWIGALLALGATSLLVIADQSLWGSVKLPSVSSPWRWNTTLLESAAPLLIVASLLLVNGVIVPFAEEWLWRRLIQPRMIASLSFAPGLVVTAVLFSLKHVIIDASLGRLLALVGFGLVMGIVAARHGWKTSALAHALANTMASLVALAFSGG